MINTKMTLAAIAGTLMASSAFADNTAMNNRMDSNASANVNTSDTVRGTANVNLGAGVNNTMDMVENSVIERLPDQGNVSLTGTVTDVDENEYVVQDSQGETIDVKATATAQDIQVGDKVRVDGQMTDELLGLGQEIERANITVVSHTDVSTQQRYNRNH